MPSRKKGELILLSSEDPKPLVSWLVDTFGLKTVLGVLSNQVPSELKASTKRASKGGKRGRPKGSKNASKKGAKKSSKKGSAKKGGKRKAAGGEVANG